MSGMTLAQLQAAIQAKGYGTDTAALQTQFINEIYREICGMQRWPFLEAQDTSLVTTVGVYKYTPPMAAWRNFDAVRLEIASAHDFVNLKYLSPQEFRESIHVDRDPSTPANWTFYAQQIQFYPIPDNTYTVDIDYTMEPPDLANPTDTPVIPQPYQDVLVWGAICSMAFRERDWLGRQFAETKKEEFITRMKEEYLMTQRQTGSHVKKSGHWSTQLPFPFTQEGF